MECNVILKREALKNPCPGISQSTDMRNRERMVNSSTRLNSKVAPGKLKSDLEDLRRLALVRGADDAVVIPASEIIVDPRVRLKCMIPKCYMSGASVHCPPHGTSMKETRDIVSRYEWAVFFRVLLDRAIAAEETLGSHQISGTMDDGGKLNALGGHAVIIYTIVKIMQKRARESGYISARGFSSGPCMDIFCHWQPTCRALMTKQGCRHPVLNSPAMESCGMDVFTMAAKMGWDVYPIGETCRPDDVPHGMLMGLVLIT